MSDSNPSAEKIFLSNRLYNEISEGDKHTTPLAEIQDYIVYNPQTRSDRFGNRYYFSPDKYFFDREKEKKAMLMVTQDGQEVLRRFPRFLRIINDLLIEVNKPYGLGKLPNSSVIKIDNGYYKITRIKEAEGSQSSGFVIEIYENDKEVKQKFFVKVRRRIKESTTGEDISQPYFYEALQIQSAYKELGESARQKRIRFPKIFFATSEVLVEEYVPNDDPNWFKDRERFVDLLEFLKELINFLRGKQNVSLFNNLLPDLFFPPSNLRLNNIFCDNNRNLIIVDPFFQTEKEGSLNEELKDGSLSDQIGRIIARLK